MILEVLNSLVVLLILVFEVDLLQVLSRRVEVVEPQDLLVPYLDLFGKVVRELLLLYDLLLELLDCLSELLTSLISLSEIGSPLVLANEHSLLYLKARGDSVDGTWAHLRFPTIMEGVLRLLDSAIHLDALLVALGDVGVDSLVKVAESLHDLVLAGKIDLFEGVLHANFELDDLGIGLLDSLVLGIEEVLEIVALLLQLPESLLPLVLGGLFLLLDVDDLVVELVVLFGQPFILLLEGHE